MTREQQLRCVGICAESHDGHVILEADRTFMMLTPREIEVFYGHLRKAYHEAMQTAKAKEATGVLV